jgi:hypothetical protein
MEEEKGGNKETKSGLSLIPLNCALSSHFPHTNYDTSQLSYTAFFT